MRIGKRGDWIAASVGAEIVMMSVIEGKYLGLNEVAARIWSLLDMPQSPDTLCDTLVEEFDVTPETCRAEIDAFIADLDSHRAIEMIP
ncbi:PqqD family protein [Sphingomonas immobilis]|uniref:PqqD family protein n=1 Tax=Sphingomonas immobilis TaxID=3063997 RepID=A0ABT8ZZZ5_9SPHN|nr:PqqD family protein [Sphingomonas sp. CA1-15]MDO7843146.1 PqqD family protein [Sphingomonas sp. CA1-15]